MPTCIRIMLIYNWTVISQWIIQKMPFSFFKPLILAYGLELHVLIMEVKNGKSTTKQPAEVWPAEHQQDY